MRTDALKHSIGTKIFGAFFAMGLIAAGLGVYGYRFLDASGNIVAATYDHPMMAINFARAASVDFLEMQNDELRAANASPKDAEILAGQIDDLAQTLSADLDVADERATAADERAVIGQIRALVRAWQSARHSGAIQNRSATLSNLDQRILDRFDMLIELNADHGFTGRRAAITEVDSYKDAVIIATAVAILLAAAMTAFLARRIVRPLSAAAVAADRIAAGEFETQIPHAGKDETGALLNSMQVMQHNIAARVAREKARAQSAEGRLMDAIESSGEGVILADCAGHIVVANSEIAKLFPGLTDQIVPGRRLDTTLAALDAECRACEGLALADIVAAGDLEGPRSLERQLPGGRWLRITASRTTEHGVILFFSDFTDIKAREENYRLAKQEAEAASAAKSRFLANMSHELRTPLNAIIGFSEILANELFGPLGTARYLEYSNDILRSGRHLLGVINSVLDLAKSESGHMELRHGRVDLLDVLTECCRMLRDQWESAGLAFHPATLQGPIMLDGDEGKLRQIFLNLLSNAIKFTDAGGRVSLRVSAGPDWADIDIEDTGIGMSPEDVATALTPFAQVDNRLERRYEGTGLGLPLAKSLVELHGGSLRIESAPGRGTTVCVRLPRQIEVGKQARVS